MYYNSIDPNFNRKHVHFKQRCSRPEKSLLLHLHMTLTMTPYVLNGDRMIRQTLQSLIPIILRIHIYGVRRYFMRNVDIHRAPKNTANIAR